MALSIPALVNREVLRWARIASGHDIAAAAKRVRDTEESLLSWERGEGRPTIVQLRRLAGLYRRPLALFYLPTPPPEMKELHDFRRLSRDVPKDFSPALRLLIRRIRRREGRVVDLLRQQGAESVAFVGSARIDDDQATLGNRVRSILGVSLESQRTWKSAEDALRNWIDSVEDAGIFVFQSSKVEVDEMRGFSFTNPLAPMIVVNAKDVSSARVFTLLHEFVHILLGLEGISNLQVPDRRRYEDRTTEIFCNAVAAEILVPAADFKRLVSSKWPPPDLDALIDLLARRYKVSREVIARRLTELGFIDRTLYRAKREQFGREFEASRPDGAREGHPPYARVVVRDNGRAFTRLVLSAYASEQIAAREVSSLLNVKLNHLPKIEAEAFDIHRTVGA
jgi:Zn-dependent peptidase ImmA (M78 family)